MAGILNTLYSLLVLLIAAAGVVYVLWTARDTRSEETPWRHGLAAGAVVLYLVAMIGALVL